MSYMKLWCKRCGGRVFADEFSSSGPRFELTCLVCGKHWFVHKINNALGRFLDRA